MYFRAIYGAPENERFCFAKGHTDTIRFPDVDLKKGDTVIHTGEEPLARREFYEYVSRVSRLGVNTIVETGGEHLTNLKYFHFLLNNRLEELRIRLYSLNNPENDNKTTNGHLTRFKLIIKIAKILKFQNISIITLAEKLDENRIRSLIDYINTNRLNKLYIVIPDKLGFNDRVEIIRGVKERFPEDHNIIIVNNGFDLKVNPDKDEINRIEIKSDKKTKTINLVIRGQCSNSCPFCTTRIIQMAYNSPMLLDDPDKIHSHITEENRKLKGANLLEIVAIEPLEYPYILNILEGVNHLGINNIRIFTHGRVLKDPSILNTLQSLGVKEITIPMSFHSLESAQINAGDRRAFSDIKKVLTNIKYFPDINFKFNIIISKYNYTDIEKIAKFLNSHGIKDYNFVLALPSIEDERYFKSYGVRLSDLLSEIAASKDNYFKQKIILSLNSVIPACLISRYYGEEILISIKKNFESITSKSISMRREYARYKINSTCRLIEECPYNKFCIGINEIYRRTFSDEEFNYR